MEDVLNIPGLTIGGLISGLFVLLIGIIAYFIKQNIEAKDERIKEQDKKIKELDNEYSRLELIVLDCKGQVANLTNDVVENRRELIKALNGIKDFISVNEKIEKQLERSNILHEDLKDLVKKIVEIKVK